MAGIVDIRSARPSTREPAASCAPTPGYHADRAGVIRALGEVLATEIACTLRYRSHLVLAAGVFSSSVASELREHASEEQAHVDWVAERITQLGGVPRFDLTDIARHRHPDPGKTAHIEEMLRDDLVAEQSAIQRYTGIIRWLENDDPTTCRLMESILKAEEEHATDIESLLRQGLR